MARIFYEVVPAGREWAVRCKARLLTLHLEKGSAIAIAAAVAEGEFDATGQPTGVRTLASDGGWEEQARFGRDGRERRDGRNGSDSRGFPRGARYQPGLGTA